MGTRHWINVVSLTKYGRDVGDAFATLFQRRFFDVEYTVVFRRRMVDLFTSIIRRRSTAVYSTSSKRCVLRHIRRNYRPSNATTIISRNDVVVCLSAPYIFEIIIEQNEYKLHKNNESIYQVKM